MIPPVAVRKQRTDNQLGKEKKRVAQGVAQGTGKSAPEAVAEAADVDPELAAVVKAWPDLPEAIRRAIRAMVEASK